MEPEKTAFTSGSSTFAPGDSSAYILRAPTHNIRPFSFPPPPTWECRLFAKYGDGYPLVLRTNAPPNRFRRWAQKIILGHEWLPLP